ncbi:hypothetical protein SDC9_154331 [bioreactor metagenome]|uniref:Uncharacterized protein n=1 Tax=bioreactor metagenome TaxID=1076179 RepID=A0A645F0P8_9ZZZZ
MKEQHVVANPHGIVKALGIALHPGLLHKFSVERQRQVHQRAEVMRCPVSRGFDQHRIARGVTSEYRLEAGNRVKPRRAGIVIHAPEAAELFRRRHFRLLGRGFHLHRQPEKVAALRGRGPRFKGVRSGGVKPDHGGLFPAETPHQCPALFAAERQCRQHDVEFVRRHRDRIVQQIRDREAVERHGELVEVLEQAGNRTGERPFRIGGPGVVDAVAVAHDCHLRRRGSPDRRQFAVNFALFGQYVEHRFFVQGPHADVEPVVHRAGGQSHAEGAVEVPDTFIAG